MTLLFIQIFPQFWLAKSTRIIHQNQLLTTKFGRILCLTRKWCQKCNPLQVNAPLTEKTWGRDWVVFVVKIKMADTSLVSRVYQNICGTKFSRYLFSARSEFGIFIVFFNEVFSSYVIRVNCVSYISCCQSVCSSFGSATPHATTLFCLTWVTRRTAMFVLVRTLKS